LSKNLKLHFSHNLNGIIWNTLADPVHNRLFLEIRDTLQKKVSFSALDLVSGAWFWENIIFDEPWWISLASVSYNVLLFTIYTDTNNPDKKSVIAFDISTQKTLWWQNDFSLSLVSGKIVFGLSSKYAVKEVALDLFQGTPVSINESDLEPEQNFPVIRPFQYQPESEHFETVRSFLDVKLNIKTTLPIEYLEYDKFVCISVFEEKNGLANNLIVINEAGDLLLNETLGDDLKGIALDTFFILSGYLIFVKNKCALVSYKMV
jgi:hypothetical protein